MGPLNGVLVGRKKKKNSVSSGILGKGGGKKEGCKAGDSPPTHTPTNIHHTPCALPCEQGTTRKLHIFSTLKQEILSRFPLQQIISLFAMELKQLIQ